MRKKRSAKCSYYSFSDLDKALQTAALRKIPSFPSLPDSHPFSKVAV